MGGGPGVVTVITSILQRYFAQGMARRGAAYPTPYRLRHLGALIRHFATTDCFPCSAIKAEQSYHILNITQRVRVQLVHV